MSFIFGDGFDLYTNVTDMVLGYWDAGSAFSGASLPAGRFSGSQALQLFSNLNPIATKNSGSNDAVHHINVAYRQSSALGGTNNSISFQLLDGSTGQCVIVFRSDGAILLQSASVGGTTLATYTGAVTAQSVWYSFEFEIVIHNTTGSFTVRKNGNTSSDFTATSLNTRPGTNTYANRLVLGCNSGVPTQQIDDLLWRSDTSSVSWAGDIRCYTRMPISDASVAFSRTNAGPLTITPYIANTSQSITVNTPRYVPFTPTTPGAIGSLTISLNSGYTGNMKCSIFASSGTVPTTVLGSATPIVNPATGSNTFTFSTPVNVQTSTQYFVGFCPDTSSGNWSVFTSVNNPQSTTTYASFPAANPATSQVSTLCPTITVTLGNFSMVAEPQQDGTTSYVYDSTVNDVDFYNIAAANSTPGSVVAVTTRGFMEKSDAGTRTGTIQLKSGATTVAAPTLSLTSGFQWAWRTDVVDPNTSSAWTTGNVDTVTIGPKLVS